MKITKGRHLSILFAIMNHDGVVTSDDLADFPCHQQERLNQILRN